MKKTGQTTAAPATAEVRTAPVPPDQSATSTASQPTQPVFEANQPEQPTSRSPAPEQSTQPDQPAVDPVVADLVARVAKLEEVAVHPVMVFNPRMVDYHLPGSGDIRPAIIVQLHGEDLADLQVFTNGQADRSVISERIVQVNVNTGADQHVVPALIHRPGVRMGNKPGQWSWPEVN